LSVLARARRGSVALLILGACGALHAHEGEAAAAARLPQRVAMLARAQAELERGDASAALDDFERTAMMLHAADAELGLIRAAMQDGQYRRALAFCAHTAGEHVDEADGGALYAWLLRVGGQTAQASSVLADVRAHANEDPIVAAVDRALASASPPVASGPLLASLHRMAPWPVMLDAQAPPPPSARFASNAVLVDDGAAALLPLSALPAHARAWVRNGLGQTTAATLDASVASLSSHGLARLLLRAPLATGASRSSAGRAPFAGSPGQAMQFGSGDAPAWPTLTQGFLGSLAGDGDARKLGFDADPGAAVLDATGVLVGVVSARSGSEARWVPLSALAPTNASGPMPPAAPTRTGLALVAPDQIYEAGLRRVLQVLVADDPP
jgi:hypothetical protein